MDKQPKASWDDWVISGFVTFFVLFIVFNICRAVFKF
jgi:hypothetical protein